MDIKQLQYFLEIVDADFNISNASANLNLSQPALSTIIKKFEQDENIQLFHRYNGRVHSLTNSGEVLYEHAKILVEQHKTMMTAIRDTSDVYKGLVRIGIPPLILSISFADILSQLMVEYPDVRFDIMDMGAYELRKSLVSGSLDFAVLLNPTGLDLDSADEYILQSGTLTAYMNTNHPLAGKEKLSWHDLGDYPLAIFNDRFMIHHHLMAKFEELNISPNIKTTSSYWDYMLLSTRSANFITILPSPINDIIAKENIHMVHFDDPIAWEVMLCHRKKTRYTAVETHTLECLITHFKIC